jgi:uncharacterized cupredoxin-like copper-binding protein
MMLMGPWLVLVVALIAAVAWASQRRDDDRDDVAVQVLDRRLAEGELTIEEHAQRRHALQERGHGSRSQSSAWGGPVAVIAAATVVVGLLVWLGMASWGGRGWMGGHMGWGGSTSSTTEIVEGARQVDVEAGDLWFDPATVEVTAGEPVNLRLVNTGAAFHDLTVPAADVVIAAEPGEDTIGSVEFSDAGRYEFYCSVPGHAQGGMRGTIVVTAAD